MQRGKLDSTLSCCPRHHYPCGVAARFWGLCLLLARELIKTAKHPALATLRQENLEDIDNRRWKMTIGVKKVDRIRF